MAQEEKRILVDRIKSGISSAKIKGVRLGRPQGLEAPEKLLKRYTKLASDIQTGLSLRKCVKIHSVSRGTVIKVKKTLAQLDTP